MPQSKGDSPNLIRLTEQLDRLLAEDRCLDGDMVVFPVPANSGSLADLARAPGVSIERIGPDVVRIRRVS